MQHACGARPLAVDMTCPQFMSSAAALAVVRSRLFASLTSSRRTGQIREERPGAILDQEQTGNYVLHPGQAALNIYNAGLASLGYCIFAATAVRDHRPDF